MHVSKSTFVANCYTLYNNNNNNNNNNTFYLRSAFQDTQGHFTEHHQNKTMTRKINLKHSIKQHSNINIQRKKNTE